MAAWCKSTCERNVEICAEIDAAQCSDNCTSAFGAVSDFCPIRLAHFTRCIDADELRCKAGAKIRAKGCDDESREMTFCLMTHAIKPEERCKGGACDEYGQCELIDGVCTATQSICDKLEKCADKTCVVTDNMCSPQP